MTSKDDLRLATDLLTGKIEQSKAGKLRNIYIKQDREERLALARLLRAPGALDRGVRNHLANLIDPAPVCWEPRIIKFGYRDKGRPPDPVHATQIAERVYSMRKSHSHSTNAAIAQAAKEFSLSVEAVKKIWTRYRPLLERIDSL